MTDYRHSFAESKKESNVTTSLSFSRDVSEFVNHHGILSMSHNPGMFIIDNSIASQSGSSGGCVFGEWNAGVRRSRRRRDKNWF